MGATVLLFVNDSKIDQSKAKDSQIKTFPLCLENIVVAFSAIFMIKSGLGGVYHFSVDYDIIDTSNIIDIHKYLMKNKMAQYK